MVDLFLSVLLLAGGGTGPPSAQCTCAGPSLDQQIHRADLIFEGIVLDTHRYSLEELEGLGVETPVGVGDTDYVFFYATRVWKGRKRHEYIVATPAEVASCGYPFKEGNRYLVYAVVRGVQASTDLCTRTMRASEAVEDRKELNELFEQ